jgi:hypothetical protein
MKIDDKLLIDFLNAIIKNRSFELALGFNAIKIVHICIIFGSNVIIKNRSFDLFESVLDFNAIKIVAFKFKEN